MSDLVVSPGVVRNCPEIIALAEQHRDRFTDYPGTDAVRMRPADWDPFDPYRDSEYEDDDQYHVLAADRMPADLLAAILRGITALGADAAGLYVQINRYDPGDYVLPHRDSLQQGLYMLTTSDRDGLVVQGADGHVVRLLDRAGTYITHHSRAWHWVDPVVHHVRYTLVTIPALVHP
jgi:hypothetical protein